MRRMIAASALVFLGLFEIGCGPKRIPETDPVSHDDTTTTTTERPKTQELVIIENQYSEAQDAAERRALAQKAADQASLSQDFARAVRWLLKAREDQNDPEEKKRLEQKITNVIDQRLSFQEVRVLLEDLDGDDFPKDVLTYKLGRIQYHVRDLSNAKTTLESFLAKWPTSPYAKWAKDLLASIEGRSHVVPGAIGVLLPLSGKLRAYGEQALEAVKLAVGEYESKKDQRVQLIVRDSKGDAVDAAKAIEDFVLVDGVVAVIGAPFRVEAEAAAYKAQELGVPFLTVSAAEKITDIGPYVFRNGLTNSQQMDALVNYAMDVLGLKSFAILYPRHPYGEALLDLFWERVEAKRGEVRAVEAYDSTATTFTAPVQALVGRDVMELRADYRKAKEECKKQPNNFRRAKCESNVRDQLRPIVDFQALFIPDYPRSLTLITPALDAEDIVVEKDPKYLRRIEKTLGRKVEPVTLLGASGWNSPELPEKAGRYVENSIFTDGFFPGSEEKVTTDFVNAYKKHLKRTPTLPEAQMFDAMKIVQRVVQSENPTSRESMRQALRKVHEFPGVTGKTSFVKATDAERPVQILTIKNGQIKEASVAEETVVEPSSGT